MCMYVYIYALRLHPVIHYMYNAHTFVVSEVSWPAPFSVQQAASIFPVINLLTRLQTLDYSDTSGPARLCRNDDRRETRAVSPPE